MQTSPNFSNWFCTSASFWLSADILGKIKKFRSASSDLVQLMMIATYNASIFIDTLKDSMVYLKYSTHFTGILNELENDGSPHLHLYSKILPITCKCKERRG